ncbi:prolyl-tRNA synthetase associated domain-containing protein [Blastochloris viridis]|uniref:Prolyl-tRNA deacylase proX n=1 Tax=Blastochloris viridis TaxID=1079 RepID=A0A0H5BIQ0_BLAVI|nr:prolyl-tRNA synthetase associated domain-containing protein [Blastochloris viridis]ALK09778.1 Prolyl-tRNA editing protein ProX [Blastochloris viridis]BAS00322.1 similarity to aminoacyl-tRNA editing enzymes YbaK [Blastochloris viridis]CUU42441.1 Prolyl-tRNA deacylase proX [Blastochloris viridis]
MPLAPDDLFALLDRFGIPSSTVRHRAVFTVAESQDVCAGIPGAHTKNLFLKDKRGRLFLVTAGQGAVLDLKHLHHDLGASGRLSFGAAELLWEVLGVTPGSVTTLAAANDEAGRVTVVLEAGLMAAEEISLHPLVNTMTTTLRRDDLVRFLEAVGHPPLVLKLDRGEDG